MLKVHLNANLICTGHLSQHDDKVHVALLHHGPEVVDGVGHGALGSDIEPLALPHGGRDVAGIDIAALVILVTEDLHPVLIIGNNIFEPEVI